MHDDLTLPDGSVRIPLRARGGGVRGYALVDAADAEWVNRKRWFLGTDGYAYRSERIDGRDRNLTLHRLILGLTSGDGMEGDHINRDRLDNRRGNLRAISKQANRQNVPGQKRRTSIYRGVSWFKPARLWQAKLTVDGKQMHLGYFRDEQEAARVVQEARLRLMAGAVD